MTHRDDTNEVDLGILASRGFSLAAQCAKSVV
jgi:hypothetical protein